jgi:undecaprenyl-diphosphatase
MTTFQAIVYAMIHGLTEFLPVSAKAHQILIPHVIEWPEPSDAFSAALAVGTALSLFIYFRHDWASMVSCFLQVILFRKKPMSLDEKLPLFIGITLAPVFLTHLYGASFFAYSPENPILYTSSWIAGTGLLLWILDSRNRTLKGMVDWKWQDALFVGVVQSTAMIPGWDPLSALLLGSFFLNYKRESALKYAYFTLTPPLVIRAIGFVHSLDFHSSMPIPEVSWISLGVAVAISFFVGLLCIGGLIKQVQSNPQSSLIARFAIYRWVLAGGAIAALWLRQR